jgi:GNAT superfamily N-acetyltransferase
VPGRCTPLNTDPLGGMNLKIQQAAPGEAALVSEILSEAALWIRELHEPLWELAQVSAAQVAPDCNAGYFHLAWSGQSALGTMRLTDEDPSFWPNAPPGEAIYIHRLAVRRAAAGGRVSTALLQHAIKVAKKRGAPFLRLDAEASRQTLRRVYEQFGFIYHSHRTVRGVRVARYQMDCPNAA